VVSLFTQRVENVLERKLILTRVAGITDSLRGVIDQAGPGAWQLGRFEPDRGGIPDGS
jgi:hypothetical protein